MTNENKRIDFDDYAHQYEDLLKKQLSFFSRDRVYFSEYKIALIAELGVKPLNILDFGCGIGLSLPHLLRFFSQSKIYATDISIKSLEHVRLNFPNINILLDTEIDNYEFDLIVAAGVFHHIPIDQRAQTIQRLSARLTKGGCLAIFEHNPFNPITRHLVASCPFDEDAELISMREMKNLVKNYGGLKITSSGYCLFFPESLRMLRAMEKKLLWLPLGGQYFVVGTTQRSDVRPT